MKPLGRLFQETDYLRQIVVHHGLVGNELGGGTDRLEFREESGDNDGGGGLIDNVSLIQQDFGANALYGGNGDDTLYGGQGTDTLYGDAGNDTFHSSFGADTIRDSGGTDTIVFDGRAQDYEINQSLTTANQIDVTGAATAETESTAIFIKTEIENLQFSDRTILAANIQTGTANADNWTGTASDSIYSGNGGNDIITGGSGHDILSGGIGDDQITGGAGNDGLHGGAGNDILYGGTGDDTLVAGIGGTDALYGEDGSDLFIFGRNSAFDTADGGAGASWTDTVQLTGSSGSGTVGVFGTDWTLNLTSGSIVSQDAHHITLSQDADGSIVFDSSNHVTFTDMEHIFY